MIHKRPFAIRKALCLICLKNSRLKLIINLKRAKTLASMLRPALLAIWLMACRCGKLLRKNKDYTLMTNCDSLQTLNVY
jgi:hypothetical protein